MLLFIHAFTKQEQTFYPGELNNGNFRYVNCDFLRQKSQILKMALPQKKNGHRIQTPSSKLVILLCISSHGCFPLQSLNYFSDEVPSNPLLNLSISISDTYSKNKISLFQEWIIISSLWVTSRHLIGLTRCSAVSSGSEHVVKIVPSNEERVIMGVRWLTRPIPQVNAEGVVPLWAQAVYLLVP